MERKDHYMHHKIENLSGELSVSTASFSRFVKKLGFENYTAFRKQLAEEMLVNLDPTKKMQTFLSKIGDEHVEMEQQIFKDITTMSKFMQKIDHTAVDKAVSEIAKSKSIVLIGLGVSRSLVYFLDFRLKRMGIRTKLMTSGGAEFIEELTTVRKDDLILTISFKREYRELLLAMKYAKKNGIRTISMTEDVCGKIAKDAEIVLEISRGPQEDLNSIALPVSFCNALLMRVATVQKEEIFDHMELLSDLNKHY
ncbi:hypothetical protein AV656_09875 [Bhargavaea cecembensis]|uniref:RpiR family transcriptional regulator n=1 Tax=Bhargavaea cecembensis TaxID=394098 RepID=A0A165GVD9_9BACL|nr:hypothetical protein AV656_09875 [Bhargavaea cecembensis]